jgi:cytochrome c553
MKYSKVKNYLPPIGSRPKCTNKGCNNECQFMGTYSKKTGMAIFRKTCGSCHGKATAKKHGLNSMVEVIAKNAGLSVSRYIKKIQTNLAKNKGFSNYTDYQNSKHRYRQHRETYCENIDGRLGFVCTTNVVDSSMLEVDHINNNNSDDSSGNHQTLCSCCHAYKTRYFSNSKELSYIKKIFTDNIVNHFESFS